MSTPPVLGDKVWFREMEEPSSHLVAITPSDVTNFTQFTRGVYVGGAGSIAVITAQGDDITISGVLAGTLFPIRVYRILATGTTATGIIAFF